MTFKLPRIAQYAESFASWYREFQIDWQKTVETIEAHETVQEGILENLQTTQAELTTAQEEIAAVQVEQAQTQADLATTVAALNSAVFDIDTAQSTADAAAAAAAAAATDAGTANSTLAQIQAAATYSSAGINLVPGATYKINGTQVVAARGAAVADATDAATAITQLNALLARMRAHGLIS